MNSTHPPDPCRTSSTDNWSRRDLQQRACRSEPDVARSRRTILVLLSAPPTNPRFSQSSDLNSLLAWHRGDTAPCRVKAPYRCRVSGTDDEFLPDAQSH